MAKDTRRTRSPGKKLKLPHSRAHDYREVWIDGFLNRVENGQLHLTAFQNDRVVVHENMDLEADDGHGSLTYRGVNVEEHPQRLDVISIRVPVDIFLETAAQVATKLSNVAAPESAKRSGDETGKEE